MRNAIIALKDKRKDLGQHPGLLLQRYLCENATGDGGNPEEKQAILQAAINAAADDKVRALYKVAFARWEKSFPSDARSVTLATQGRLIVGLGSENVLETGIRLQHTYGLPIIPGSALKGLAAHYCDQVWGAEDEKFKKPTKEDDEAYRKHLQDGGKESNGSCHRYHRLLFGNTDDSGCIIFHDAWYVPESSPRPLRLDVMTPHHLKWLDGSAPPTDFDSPTPVPFLSVTGQFHVVVSWRGPDSEESGKWLDATRELLTRALAEWGVGGKTSSGYGRLVDPKKVTIQTMPRGGGSQGRATREKRPSGTRTRVRIVAQRPKGGYDVQEDGYSQGTLTVGSPPGGVQPNIDDQVDVEVHDDVSKKPQYRWPGTPRAKTPKKAGKRRR